MLSLSSEAAPQLALDALAAARRARGLDGEELVIAGAADAADAAALAVQVRAAGARVVALRASTIDDAPAIAGAAAALGAPVSVPPGVIARDDLPRIARAFAAAGARLLLGHGTHLDDALATIAAIRAAEQPAALGLAWELRPGAEDLRDAGATLCATVELLGVVRLHGGGPEQRDHDGHGLGPLLVDLALSGYAGPIILCPSRPEAIARWRTWLETTRSAGCGHAAGTRTVTLDVRDVEPRDRLDTILGAYRALAPGGTLALTVDHDPVCMYYTLEAMEPEGSFTFHTLEHGPEVWRAEVTRR